MIEVVALRPDYEMATHYGQYYCEKLYVDYAKELGYNVVDLYGENCIRSELEKYKDVKFIAGVCHGNVNIIVGQHNSVLFREDEWTKEFCKDKIFIMLSCYAGKELLKWMIDQGAIASIGYTEEFIFVTSIYPNSFAEPFFKSHFSGVQCLLQGKTVKESYGEIRKTFDKYLNDPSVPEAIKPYLLHDRNCLVMWGNPNARLIEHPDVHFVRNPNEYPKSPAIEVRDENGKLIGTYYKDSIIKVKPNWTIRVCGSIINEGNETANISFIVYDELSKSNVLNESYTIKPDETVNYNIPIKLLANDMKLSQRIIYNNEILDKEEWFMIEVAGYKPTAYVKVVLKRIRENKGRVVFNVIDEDNNPVEGALIELDGMKSETNKIGVVVFDNVEIKDYKYIVSKTGYQTVEGIIRKEDFK